MRYVGQSYELEVPVEGGFDDGLVPRLVEEFQRTHERIYRQRNETAEVELVNLRAVWFARVPRVRLDPPVPGPSWEAAQHGERAVFLPGMGGLVPVPVYRRDRLPVGVERPGPFIVEQADSTTVVMPGERCRMEPHGNLVVAVAPGHG
jgi:N-methylhydantoinase A